MLCVNAEWGLLHTPQQIGMFVSLLPTGFSKAQDNMIFIISLPTQQLIIAEVGGLLLDACLTTSESYSMGYSQIYTIYQG